LNLTKAVTIQLDHKNVETGLKYYLFIKAETISFFNMVRLWIVDYIQLWSS